MTPDERYKLVTLSPTDEEYKAAAKDFQQTIGATSRPIVQVL